MTVFTTNFERSDVVAGEGLWRRLLRAALSLLATAGEQRERGDEPLPPAWFKYPPI